MFKLIRFAPVFVGLGFFIAAQSSALGNDGNQLRVGTLQLEPHLKMILLGIATEAGNPAASLNFKQLGFKGSHLEAMNPKFLLEVNQHGIQQVYAFELPYNN